MNDVLRVLWAVRPVVMDGMDALKVFVTPHIVHVPLAMLGTAGTAHCSQVTTSHSLSLELLQCSPRSRGRARPRSPTEAPSCLQCPPYCNALQPRLHAGVAFTSVNCIVWKQERPAGPSFLSHPHPFRFCRALFERSLHNW